MNDNIKEALKVIDDLLKAGIGDSERLKSIKKKLENKIPVTAEDVEYLQEEREGLAKIKPKAEPRPKPEKPIEDTTEIIPSEKPPEVKDSKKSMSKKKIIVLGVVGFFSIMILSVSAYAYFTIAPLENIERLENAQTMEEFESVLEEIDTNLEDPETGNPIFGAITSNYCLEQRNRIDAHKSGDTWQGTIAEWEEEFWALNNAYDFTQCQSTVEQWDPCVKLHKEGYFSGGGPEYDACYGESRCIGITNCMTKSEEEKTFRFEETLDTELLEQLRSFTHSSSLVGNVKFNAELQEMKIFLNGKHYDFCGVSERLFDAFEGASYKGALFASSIKGQYNC